MWSGRQDLNLRPPAPQAGALPGCATPRETSRRMYLPPRGGSSRSVGAGTRRGGLGGPVERALQHLARTERQDAPLGDLDLLAALERLLHGVEDQLDDLGGLLLGEAHLLVDAFDDVGLRHGHSVCLPAPERVN